MLCRPARSTMTDGPQAATAVIRWEATPWASARLNSPHKATTARPSASRMLRPTLSMGFPGDQGRDRRPGPARWARTRDERGTSEGLLAEFQHQLLPPSRDIRE